MRRWTAIIEIDGVELDATLSSSDLKQDQTRQAIKDVEDLGADEAGITVYKTTKANGTVRDRFWTVYRDPRTGQLRAI